VSAPVKQWVQSLHLKAIQVASDRAKDRKRRLGATHFRVLLHLADRARHNGLAWPGMADIAKAAEIGIDLEHPDLRRARRVVRDLELAGLIKCQQFRGRVKGKEYASSEYWVRVPWVAEPDHVSDLPKLGNDELPPGVRTKEQKGGRAEIDVDHYIRQEKLGPVNRAPAPDLDEVVSAKSGAGVNDVAVNRAPEALNRAPVSGLNRAPAPSKSGIFGESGSEAASSEAVSARLRARDKKGEAIGELNTRTDAYVQQSTLHGFAAVGLSSEPTPAMPTSVFDTLAEGKRIWESARHLLLRPGAARISSRL